MLLSTEVLIATLLVVAFLILTATALLYRRKLLRDRKWRLAAAKISPPSSKDLVMKPSSNNVDFTRFDFMAQV